MAEMFTKAAAYERLMGRWSRQLAPLFLNFSAIRDGESVLDVGCGTGSLTGALIERLPRARLVGIDVSQAAIDYCRDRYAGQRVGFDCGDAMRLPYRDQEFDHSARLENFEESTLEFETAFANFDDYWDPFIQGVGPYGIYTDRLSEESRAALREQLRKRILQGRLDGPFAMRARAFAVRGTVPG